MKQKYDVERKIGFACIGTINEGREILLRHNGSDSDRLGRELRERQHTVHDTEATLYITASATSIRRSRNRGS